MNPWQISTIVLIVLIALIAIILLIYFKIPHNVLSVVPSIAPKMPSLHSNYLIIFPILLILGAVITVYYDKTVTLWAKDSFLLNLLIVLALLSAVIWVFQTKQTNSIVIDYFKIRKLEVTMAFVVLYIMFAFLSVTIIFTYAALYESQKVCHPLMYYLGNKRGCRSDPNVNDKTRALKINTQNASASSFTCVNYANNEYNIATNAYSDAKNEETTAYNKEVIASAKNVLAKSQATKAETAASLATNAYSSFTTDSKFNLVAKAAKDFASAVSHANLATINAEEANDAYEESDRAAEQAKTDLTDTIRAFENVETAKTNAEQAKTSTTNDFNTIASTSVRSSAYRAAETAKTNVENNYNKVAEYLDKIDPLVKNAQICVNNAKNSANNAKNSATEAQSWADLAESAKTNAENAKTTYETTYMNNLKNDGKKVTQVVSSSFSGVGSDAKKYAASKEQSSFTNMTPDIQSASRLYSNSLARFQPVSDFFKTCLNSYETLQNRYFDAQEKTIDALTNAVFDPINTHVLPFINKPVEKYLQ